MPKYFCDYCDTFLTHDSPSVRKTHCSGRKHKDNVKFFYQRWLEDQAQSLIDATAAAFRKGQISTNPFAQPVPGSFNPFVPPPPAVPRFISPSTNPFNSVPPNSFIPLPPPPTVIRPFVPPLKLPAMQNFQNYQPPMK